MLFSIIISVSSKYYPYYNDAISSVLNQTFDNFEVIIVKFVKDNIALNKINQKCKIVSCEIDNFCNKINTGLKFASGEYILILDCDDILSKNCLANNYKIIKNFNCPDLICFGFSRNINQLGSAISHLDNLFIKTKKNCSSLIFDRFFAKNRDEYKNITLDSHWGKCFKRKIIVNNNIIYPVKQYRAEDVIFVCNYSFYISTIYINNKDIDYYWRDNEKSEMKSYNSLFYDIAKYIEELKKILIKAGRVNNLSEYFLPFLFEQIAFFYYLYKNKTIKRNFFIEKCKWFIPKNSVIYHELVSYSKCKNCKFSKRDMSNLINHKFLWYFRRKKLAKIRNKILLFLKHNN